MPGPLDVLERMMEEAVEGSVRRLFRPKLQPVQLAKAAAREMEAKQIIGPSGPQVPNSYSVSLHPKDFERFARFQLALQAELEKYLRNYATDRQWRPVSRVSVTLTADSSVPLGRARVVARMMDTALEAAPAGEQGEAWIERTVRQRRLEPRPASVAEAGPAVNADLVSDSGERYRLGQPVVTIGRALENDVVLADTRVSRFHAEVRKENGRFVLRDLGSTNGTGVGDEAVEQHELHDGEIISLGGYRLTYRET